MQPPLSELSPADRHRVVAHGFADVVAQVTDWSAPSPVPDWRARDVVSHLTTWFPAFLAGTTGHELPSAAGDPVTDWRAQSAAVQRLLDNPAVAGAPVDHPHAGGAPLADVVDRFYTTDVFLHTWDLAQAAGVPAALDDDHCVLLLSGMREHEEVLRTSGHYGPAVAPPDDADAATRLLAFLGRDPFWAQHH